MDLNRLILGKSYNSTKVFRTAQHVVQAILLGVVVPALILLLIWDLTDNPNPVPGVVVIAGLVMLCFFFSYVFGKGCPNPNTKVQKIRDMASTITDFILIYNLIPLFCLDFGIPMASLNSFIFFLNQFT